jgi:tripartite-type tricarboxylate transporter receptor subunit TctC
VPFAAGSQLDVAARLIAAKLAAAVAQPVVVENHPGATGDIGARLVATSAPDGYTLLITGSAITSLPSTAGERRRSGCAFAPLSKVAKVPSDAGAPVAGVGTSPSS